MAHRKERRPAQVVLAGLLLAILSAGFALAGEAAPRRDAPGETKHARALARSIRIAEARNRQKAKRYFRSACRQEKTRRAHPGKREARR